MNTRDIIKKSFLENTHFQDALTVDFVVETLMALLTSAVFGLLIFFIYKKFFSGVVYQRSFAITLMGMTVLTCMVTLAISSNIVISLGMVGALSIVRYRTAIKDPIDLLYLFWSITTGITVGAGIYPLSIAAFVIMVAIIVIMTRRSKGSQVYIAIVHYDGDASVGDSVRRALGSMRSRIKSKTLRGTSSEMAIEVFVRNQNLSFVEKIRMVPGVQDVTVIQYDGDYRE